MTEEQKPQPRNHIRHEYESLTGELCINEKNGSPHLDYVEYLENRVANQQDYARLQIEKDRERVKENVRCINEGNINGAGESEEYYAVDLASIDQTPIILD